jgi:DEAD/DEAH box helicase domain-containing protein
MKDDYIYLDVEVQRTADEAGGWHRDAFRKRSLAVAVTWCKQHGYRDYFEQDVRQLLRDLRAAQCVVGYCCLSFDYEVLRGHHRFRTPPTIDLFKIVSFAQGFRVSLDSLVRGTFGRRRSSDGNRNTELWKKGKTEAVVRACRRDVLLIRRLHEHILRYGWVQAATRESTLDRIQVTLPEI